MRIKTKLTLGVGLLFVLIVLLSVLGAKYSNDLKKDTENILVSNYNSLMYTKNMLVALETNSENDLERFEQNLKNQQENITEHGEKEITEDLLKYFEYYKADKTDSVAIHAIRSQIFKIIDMNMHAIQRKSEIARSTADRAVFWIAISGTLCFIIAFILLINLPSNIADPIQELTESIQQIADKNYSQRVYFKSQSEFGQLANSFNTMAQKLEEYNNSSLAKIMMEKKRIEALINNMHDPVIGLDQNLKILFANEQAIRIIGLSQKSIIQKSAIELSVENDLIRSLIKDLLSEDSEEQKNSKQFNIYLDNKEGYFEKENLHISIIPTGEQNPVLIGHVIILRNVTEYKELDFAKTNFIATVSHEFKTPISSIIMSLQLLENDKIGRLNEEQKVLLISIKEDVSRLLKITSELLNMAQVESGNIQLSIKPTGIKELLHFAINATKTQADQKDIRIDLDYPDTVPEVYADNDKVVWVMTNLISNAIRYSNEHATVFVSVTTEPEKVVLSVRDTGQGIAPEYKSKIFERYFRVPGTLKEGSGLGLAISKEFIQAMGGNISVESELGKGSTFRVALNAVMNFPNSTF